MEISIRNIGVFVLYLLLMVTAFFMVNVDLPPWSYLISGLSVILFLIPTYHAAFRWLGFGSSIVLIFALGMFALGIETSAILTGIPYGHFSYSGLLGYRLFGVVPWTVAFAWTPLILAAYAVAYQIFGKAILRILFVSFLLLIFDLVLDPGAVYLGFWEYQENGSYYGVPWSNYLGWVASGAIGAGLLELLVHRIKPLLPAPVQLMKSGILTIFFWTSIDLFAGMILPALIGIAVLLFLTGIYLNFYYSFDEMVVLVDDDNQPIGIAPKLTVHTMDTPLHRAFSVFLFNRKGELLLQQRAEHKKTWGSIWSNSCCGHVMLHERLVRAAARRLKYELGFRGIALKVMLPDFRYRAEKDGVVENEICPVLVGFTDQDPDINPDEVADFEWLAWREFLSRSGEPESDISPWAIEEAELLEENPEFRRLYESQTQNGEVD